MMSPGLQENPGYLVELKRLNERVEVFLNGECIADSMDAIRLQETGQDAVIYIPKNDLKNVDLIKCGDYFSPFKGHAELYTIKHGDKSLENAAWSYDGPFDEVQELQGRVAFSLDQVDEIRVMQ